MADKIFKNIKINVGDIFGKWTVIASAAPYLHKGRVSQSKFKCRCTCGNECEVFSGVLRNGKSSQCKSCANFIDLTAQTVGKLRVVNLAEKTYTNPASGEILKYWNCVCDCGTAVIRKGADLRLGNNSSCGCGTRQQLQAIQDSRKLVDPSKRDFDAYRHSAQKRNLDFQLSVDFFCNMIKLPCHYCGDNTGILKFPGTYREYRANGIDRVDNSIGYTPDNVVPCCRMCNIAKNNYTVDKFLDWAKNLVKHQGEKK